MTMYPDGSVRGRCQHAPRAGEKPRRAFAQTSHGNPIAEQAAGVGHAGLAAWQVGFAAITLVGAHQGDARAEPGIIVHVHVVRQPKALDQRQYGGVVADQMVYLCRGRPVGLEQPQQVRQLVRQGIAQIGIAALVPVADDHRRPAVRTAAGTQHDGAAAGGAVGFGRHGDHAFHAAAFLVRYQDDSLLTVAPRRAPSGKIQRPPRGGQWVGRAERLHEVLVAGVQPLQDRAVARPQRRRRGAEGGAPNMGDEHAGRGNMPPAEMARTQAEVVFLAVALGEDVGPEQADRVQAVAADIQAKTDADRNVDQRPAVGPLRQRIEPFRLGPVGHGIAAHRSRVAQDAGVVRQRRHGADVGRRARRLGQPREPARRHQRVAVEQDDVAARACHYSGIRAGGESAVVRRPDQRDPPLRRQRIQRLPQRRLG